MAKSMIEPDFAEPYAAWQKKPGPETNLAMLNVLQPTIEGAIRTHVGQPNPMLTSRARLMTLDGLKSYDPGRGRLQTHLYNHLQGLKRANRKQTSILRVPERVAIGRQSLENAENELRAELGREPNDEEISNHTGFSARQMARVRSYDPAIAEGTLENAPHGGGLLGGVQGQDEEKNQLWRDAVYDELDDYHRLVMEHSIGLNGKRVLSGQQLAAKLQRSGGAISQAKARIQQKLDEAYEMSQLL